MRIGVRILLGYLLVLGVLSVPLLAALPTFVSESSRRSYQTVLAEQAQRVAEDLARAPDPNQRMRGLEALVSADLVAVDLNRVVVHEAPQTLGGGQRTTSHLGQQVPPAVVSGALKGNRVGYSGPLFGQPVVAGVAPILQNKKPTGFVIAWRSAGSINLLARGIRSEVFTWTITSLLLAGLLSWFLTRGIEGRLLRVGEAAHALAEGDLTVRAPENEFDELGELGQSFNHMAGRIQTLVEGLNRSERLRRELMASLAHELRTPVTSIQGFSEALRDGIVTDPEKQQRYLQIMAGEAERLTRLVGDLFDFTRLEAGQLDFRIVSLDPQSWLLEAVERARARLERQGIHLDVQGDPGPAPILGDRQRLEQVLTNLLDNAARYSPAGAAITLRVQPETAGLRLEVQDQGPGIPPEEVPKVFDRFFQGKNPGTKAGGAGLGLAIAQSIIQGHGGQIGVRSEPGHGACFWFTLRYAP